MTFTTAELVAIRKFCGYRARTTAVLVWEAGAGDLEYILARMEDDEAEQVRTVYLTKLQELEDNILLAGDAIDTDEAAIWKRNRNEMGDRTALYNGTRLRLCQFLGAKPGPGLGGGGCRIVRC
jgi:hypothetical protein